MHDASKVLMGATESSDRSVTCESGDPASFPAGLAVRRASTGLLSLSSGGLIGVSLGKNLSDITKTDVCRAGDRVPLELAKSLVQGDLTFISKKAKGVAIAIEFVDGGTAGSEVVTVTGDDESGWLISVEMEDETSTATQLKTALDAEADALALIDTVIASGAGSTAQDAFEEDDIDDLSYAAPGVAVRVHSTLGRGIPTGGTLTGATYVSEAKTGIDAFGGADKDVALIDMGGGL